VDKLVKVDTDTHAVMTDLPASIERRIHKGCGNLKIMSAAIQQDTHQGLYVID